MGNTDHGAAFLKLIDGFLDFRFRVGIQGGCRLVKNQDGSITEKGSRQADASLLTARKHDPAFADPCLVLPRQIENKIMGEGLPGRLFDFGTVDPQAPQTDVFGNRCVKRTTS